MSSIIHKTKHELTWDYGGWEKLTDLSSPGPFTQVDWNQTLMVKINQISNQIHRGSFRGGADTIYINSLLEPLLKSLLFFNDYKILKMRVVVTKEMKDNIILIRRTENVSEGNTIIIPVYTPGENSTEEYKPLLSGEIPNMERTVDTDIELAQLSMKLIPSKGRTKEDAKLVDDYVHEMGGIIKIDCLPKKDD